MMQKKLNEDFLDDYCEKFALKVTSDYFKEGKDVLKGDEILEVTPSRQVNLFVIKLLFMHWKEEMKRLESPFFNYQSENVRQAMAQFMNVLSQHIEVGEERLQQLLSRAVKDTIYLAAVPQVYIKMDMESRGVEKIREVSVERMIKYLKIHKQKVADFLSNMQGLTVHDVNENLPKEFDDFDTTEELNAECLLLTEILEITTEELFSNALEMDHFNADDLVEEQSMSVDTISEINEGNSPTEEDVSTEENEYSGLLEVPDILESETRITGEETPTSMAFEDEDQDPPHETINKQFEKEEEKVVDHLENNIKRKSILEMISLNDRHIFIKNLFQDDKSMFEKVLFELEKHDSFDESIEFLVQDYVKSNQWNMQSDEVKSFLKILFRRFR